MLASPMLADGSEAAFRAEMEVNVFGMPRMGGAFAPVLAKNGGGAIANILSVVSWFVFPFNATYCASKHTALALTEGVRMQLKAKGTRVVAVYAGFIDTDMAGGVDRQKTPPQQVAERTLDGIRKNLNDVHADERSEVLLGSHLPERRFCTTSKRFRINSYAYDSGTGGGLFGDGSEGTNCMAGASSTFANWES